MYPLIPLTCMKSLTTAAYRNSRLFIQSRNLVSTSFVMKKNFASSYDVIKNTKEKNKKVKKKRKRKSETKEILQIDNIDVTSQRPHKMISSNYKCHFNFIEVLEPLERNTAQVIQKQQIIAKGRSLSIFKASFRKHFSSATKGKSLSYSHSDLKSYLQYAESTFLDKTSTNFRGTLYEYTVMQILTSQFNLKHAIHSGRAYDNGVDIRGFWYKRTGKVSSEISRLSVLIQCKCVSRSISAQIIREIIGIYDYNSENKRNTTVIILAAPSMLTKQAMSQLYTSNVPIMFCRIEAFQSVYLDQDLDSVTDLHTLSLLKGINSNPAADRLLKSMGISFEETQKYGKPWDIRMQMT